MPDIYIPHEKYSANGFPAVEMPHDFALTIRTSLSRERVVECLARHFGKYPGWDVTRMEDPFTAEGRRLDLVMYPEPARTTQYHVSVGARRARPGMLRIRLKRQRN